MKKFMKPITSIALSAMLLSVTAGASCVSVNVNGNRVNSDVSAMIVNDRTMIPFRAIAESIGADVTWNDNTKTACSEKNGDNVEVDINSCTMTLNGKKINLDAAPFISEGRTFVPLRAFCEALNCNVSWDALSNLVSVFTNTGNQFGTTNQPTEDNAGNGNSSSNTGNNSALQDILGNIELPGLNIPNRPVTDNDQPIQQPSVDTDTPIQKPSVDTDVPTQKPTVDQNQSSSNYEIRVFELVNAERAKYGLSALSYSEELANVARAHSADMSAKNYFSHTSLTGLSPFDRIKNAGISYKTAAENIAAGQQTPEAVVEGWMNSSGHRANILNSSMTKIGVGYYTGGSYGTYWTQVFTG